MRSFVRSWGAVPAAVSLAGPRRNGRRRRWSTERAERHDLHRISTACPYRLRTVAFVSGWCRAMIVTFEDLELDLAQVELRRSGARVRVEPQVFEVLAYLVNHRDRVVPKEELMDSVWGGRFVSETAVTSRIKQARQAVGDNGQAQRLIRTVHSRGYRFVGPAREVGSAPAPRQQPVAYADGLPIAYQVTGGGGR